MVSIFPDTPAPLLVSGSHQPGGRGGGCVPHLLLAGEVGCVRSYSSLARLVEPVCEAVCVSCERPEGDVSLVFLWLRYPWVSVSSYDKVVTSPSFSHLLAGAFVCCWMTAGSVDVLFWVLLYTHCCFSVAPSCPVLCDPVDCSPPASSVHGTSQARMLEWAAASCPRAMHCDT